MARYLIIRRVLLLLTAYVLSYCNIAYSQPVNSIQYSTQNGLPSNKVYALLEDRNGFIWTCTDRGVSRYDGVKFENFSTAQGLPDNDVLNIVEDAQGRIWFISFGREPAYFYNEKIYHYQNDSFLNYIRLNKASSPMVYAMEVQNRELFFKVKWGNDFAFVSIGGKRVEGIGNYLGSDGISMTYLKVVQKGKAILWDRSGMYEINEGKYQRTTYGRRHLYNSGEQSQWIFYAEIDKEGWGYINTATGEIVPLGNEKVRYVYGEGMNKGVYIITEREVITGHLDQRGFRRNQGFIPEFQPLGLWVSKKGDYWFNSGNSGLFYVPSQFSKRLFGDGKVGYAVLKIQDFKGKVYLGTDGKGLIEMDEEGRKTLIKGTENLHRILNMVVWNQSLYLGTDDGVFRFNENDKSVILFEKNSVKDLQVSFDNELLVTTSGGAIKFTQQTREKFTPLRSYSVFKTKDGNIYVGGITGLYVKRKGGVDVEKVSTQTALDNSTITDIKESRTGWVWFTTGQRGVFYRNSAGKYVQIKNTGSIDIEHSSCKQIIIDAQDNIWVCSSNGLIKIDGSTLNRRVPGVQIFSVFDGMPDKEINDILLYKNSFLIGTSLGCSAANPKPFESEPAEIFISEVKVNGMLGNFDLSQLEHDQNNIELTLTSSFLRAGLSSYHFRYRIPELSNQWLDLYGNHLPISFLIPGKYTLEIMAMGGHDKKGKIKRIEIRVLSAWYKTTWFLILITFVAIGIIVYFVTQEGKKLRLKSELSSMRLRVIRSNLNPHFLFNSLSNIQYFIYKERNKVATQYIFDVAFLLRKSLEYSALDWITLAQEIEYLQRYMTLEKMRFEDKIQLELNYELSNTDLGQILVPPLLLQPLLENSIKHGFKDKKEIGIIKVTLKVELENSKLVIVVIDNGSGFQLSQQKKGSMGMNFTQERLNLLFNDQKVKPVFYIESEVKGKNKGTRITIEVPLRYK